MNRIEVPGRLLLSLALAASLGLGAFVVEGAQAQESEQQNEARMKRRAETEATARARQMEAERRSRPGRLHAFARARGLAPQLRVRAPMAFGGLFGEGGIAERVLGHAEDLELTDGQTEQIRTLRTDHRRAEIERDAAIEVAELDLEGLMRDETSADLAAVESKMLEIARLRVEARMAGLRLNREVTSVLTDEQRAQLEDMGPFRTIFRTREGGPVEFRMRRGPEGEFFFHDGEEGHDFRLDDELFEALEPLRHFEHWFEGPHEHDEPLHLEEQSDEGTSGVARRSAGVATGPAA